jgi:hypothetical protein
MDKLWLPTGQHWGLNISHDPRPDAGEFVASDPKTVWHTTEGTSFDGARQTLIDNGDEPHFLVSVDGRHVVQFIALDRSSKSLLHPAGTPETNRAHCVQIEVCGFAHDSHNWTDEKYRRLASLAALIEHRTGVERHTHVRWAKDVRRIGPDHFRRTTGHVGHMHVPNNNHVDPGVGFRITDLFGFMGEAEKKYQ